MFPQQSSVLILFRFVVVTLHLYCTGPTSSQEIKRDHEDKEGIEKDARSIPKDMMCVEENICVRMIFTGFNVKETLKDW